MAHGGPRPGSGRPKGGVNTVSKAARAAAAKTGRLPHELLLMVSRGERIPVIVANAETGQVKVTYRYPTYEEMIAAAKDAAPYYAPRLAAFAAKINTPGNPWEEILAFADGKTRGLPPGNADPGSTPSD